MCGSSLKEQSASLKEQSAILMQYSFCQIQQISSHSLQVVCCEKPSARHSCSFAQHSAASLSVRMICSHLRTPLSLLWRLRWAHTTFTWLPGWWMTCSDISSIWLVAWKRVTMTTPEPFWKGQRCLTKHVSLMQPHASQHALSSLWKTERSRALSSWIHHICPLVS